MTATVVTGMRGGTRSRKCLSSRRGKGVAGASAIVGEPGNPLVIYIGAASGGIFKTTNGGVKWTPVFDDQDVSSIGALAIAPSNHSIVWAGTGEPWLIRPDHAMGDGIYKSVD